jgi:hypothetical protein
LVHHKKEEEKVKKRATFEVWVFSFEVLDILF